MPLLTSSGSRLITHRVATVTSWWLAGGISGANCIGAYAPKGAADLAASYVNLANPGTYNAAPGIAPNFNAATGWGFTGTQYLTTGIDINSGNWSAICRFSGYTTGRPYGFAWDVYFGHAIFGAQLLFGNGGQTASTLMSSGVSAIAGQQAYKNGVADVTMTLGTWTTHRTFIGTGNFNGGPSAIATITITSIVFYNTVLTATQVAAVGTAMP